MSSRVFKKLSANVRLILSAKQLRDDDEIYFVLIMGLLKKKVPNLSAEQAEEIYGAFRMGFLFSASY